MQQILETKFNIIVKSIQVNKQQTHVPGEARSFGIHYLHAFEINLTYVLWFF